MCASGERFKYVDLLLRKSSGGTAASTASVIYLAYGFSSVIIKSIGYSLPAGAEAPKEKLVFEYEALSMVYPPQKSDGTFESYTLLGPGTRSRTARCEAPTVVARLVWAGSSTARRSSPEAWCIAV
jgi:type VI protein secretion system component Hcp